MNQDNPLSELVGLDGKPLAVVQKLGREQQTLNAPAAYWRARYEALEARISDPDAVNASAAIVLSAATIAANTNQPFRQVFQAMLTHLIKTRRLKHAAQTPARKRTRK